MRLAPYILFLLSKTQNACEKFGVFFRNLEEARKASPVSKKRAVSTMAGLTGTTFLFLKKKKGLPVLPAYERSLFLSGRRQLCFQPSSVSPERARRDFFFTPARPASEITGDRSVGKGPSRIETFSS
jgi:hypothetical protein